MVFAFGFAMGFLFAILFETRIQLCFIVASIIVVFITYTILILITKDKSPVVSKNGFIAVIFQFVIKIYL